jgi:RES domain
VSAPWPPPDLAARVPVLIKLEVGEIVHRFFTAAYDPIYFDHSREGRLNAPDGSYGMLYTAKDARGAFAETLPPGARTHSHSIRSAHEESLRPTSSRSRS